MSHSTQQLWAGRDSWLGDFPPVREQREIMENKDEIKNMGDDTGVVNVVEAEAEKQVRYE